MQRITVMTLIQSMALFNLIAYSGIALFVWWELRQSREIDEYWRANEWNGRRP